MLHHLLDAAYIGALSFRDRLLINMIAIIMLFFRHDERLMALKRLLYSEIDHESKTAENFGSNVEALAEVLKMERRFDPAHENETEND
jgi:hypothetical protein